MRASFEQIQLREDVAKEYREFDPSKERVALEPWRSFRRDADQAICPLVFHNGLLALAAYPREQTVLFRHLPRTARTHLNVSKATYRSHRCVETGKIRHG